MIASAAVKIIDYNQNGKEIIIPCHRHCDAFYILKEFGYKPHTNYKEVEQGFLDENGNFLNRVDAWFVAKSARQLKMVDPTCHTLYSEDLW